MAFRHLLGPHLLTEGSYVGLYDIPEGVDPETIEFEVNAEGFGVLGLTFIIEPAEPPTTFSVELCQQWNRIAVLSTDDAYEFHGVTRRLENGEWALTFPEGAGAWEGYRPTDVDTVVLVEDGARRYFGYVAQVSEGQGGVERVRDVSGDRWMLSGPDLWYALESRLAFPDPTESSPSSWLVSHDERTDIASTVLAGYLNDNLGGSALEDRAADFNAIDTVTGEIGSWSVRLQTLAEVAKRICGDADLIVHMSIDTNGLLIVRVEQPRDLSETKLLSDKADFTRLITRNVPARSTWVLAGGQGEGTGRVFRRSFTGETGTLRREKFTDQSSLTTGDEVLRSARAHRRNDAATWFVSVEVSDVAAQSLGFGRSVFVGEKVTIEVDGQRHVVPVQSIAWEITSQRQQVHATLGTAAPDLLRGLTLDVAGLADRFDRNIA
jgi:hypothetical protein